LLEFSYAHRKEVRKLRRQLRRRIDEAIEQPTFIKHPVLDALRVTQAYERMWRRGIELKL
jgi:hypothetical protein